MHPHIILTASIKGCHIQNEMSSSNCSIRNILILRSYGLGKKHHFKQWHLGISNNLSEIIHWFILTVFSWYLYIDKNMGRFLTPSPRKLQLAQIYIGGNSGARGGGGGGHMAKRLVDPIIYGDATPPVFSWCPPQLCMLTLNNNRLDIHLTCVCSTIKDFHLYSAGVQNNPRQHFIQSIFRTQRLLP